MDSEFLWEILVPCNWNNSKPVRTRHHREWDKKVRKISGGITIMGPVKGQWVNGEEIYSDRLIPVRIRSSKKNILKIMDLTITHYDQLAVMCYKISDECLVKYAKPSQIDKFTHKEIPESPDQIELNHSYNITARDKNLTVLEDV